MPWSTLSVNSSVTISSHVGWYWPLSSTLRCLLRAEVMVEGAGVWVMRGKMESCGNFFLSVRKMSPAGLG